jgi:hypothetical protein
MKQALFHSLLTATYRLSLVPMRWGSNRANADLDCMLRRSFTVGTSQLRTPVEILQDDPAIVAAFARLGFDIFSAWLQGRDLVIGASHMPGNEFIEQRENATVGQKSVGLASASPADVLQSGRVSPVWPRIRPPMTASRFVLNGLLPHLSDNCSLLIPAISQLFLVQRACCQNPELPAAGVSISRRTLDRYLRRAGVRSTRLLFASARATNAFSKLAEHSASLERIGRDLGCASFRPIQRQCVSLTGAAITDLVGRVSADEFGELVLAGLMNYPQNHPGYRGGDLTA